MVERRETMWADLKPDVYDGPNCDQIKHRWNVYADGDKQDDWIHDAIELDPKVFPPGTRVTVEEPLCPNCGDIRYIESYPGEEIRFNNFCECGFNWKEWTYNEYS